jgi:hypothetical protein
MSLCTAEGRVSRGLTAVDIRKWQSLPGWSELQRPERISWRPFTEARAFAQALGLKSQSEWAAWRKSGARPMDIPTNPYSTYEEFICWSDWLGVTNRRTPAEWVAVAEKLAREHKGVLPNRWWLQQNGYVGLVQCMRKHPRLFRHIKQDVKRRTSEQTVVLAERLARRHRGVMPNSWWLQQNGYVGLDQCMRKHPRLFRHIKQDSKRGRTPEEWVPVAEELARQHRGVLPNRWWLQQNRYSGLDFCMQKHPRLFRHIKQLKLDTHGRKSS